MEGVIFAQVLADSGRTEDTTEFYKGQELPHTSQSRFGAQKKKTRIKTWKKNTKLNLTFSTQINDFYTFVLVFLFLVN